jgi:hypothetical protein
MNAVFICRAANKRTLLKDDNLCHFTGPEYVRHTIFPSRVQVPVPTDSVVLTLHVEGGGLSR